jgi:type II secretory pathway predicted ATPase ExeA
VYKEFFGLAKYPFDDSPDPYFFFGTAETDKTYSWLLNGIRARNGLILLVGEVGTGKTLLLRKVVEQLYEQAATLAFVFNPRLSATEFLDYVLSSFELEHDSNDRPQMFKTLQEWLLGRHQMGLASVLIIDEAQDLSTEAFEVVRALSNMEILTEKLLQIILSGQREIEGTLKQPELKPVTQRIALRLRTCPLSPAETLQYIAHRLRVAGGDVETTFTAEAVKAVSRSSAGIPRLINQICEHALITGYADKRKPVGAETVQEVAREFGLGVAGLGEEALADEVSGPLETGALTPQITETTNLASPPTQPATQRVSPESHETPIPSGAQTYAGTSAEVALTPQGGASVKSLAPQAPAPTGTPPRAPEVIPQPDEEQVPARINNIRPKPALEGPGTLRWALLALISMGVALVGWHFIGGALSMKTRPGEPPNSRSQSPISEKSPTDNLAGSRAPSPSGRTGGTDYKQAPTQPATPVSSGKAGQVTAIPAKSAKGELPSGSPRPLSGFTSRSSEMERPRTQATRGTAVPPPSPKPGQVVVTSNVPGAKIIVDGRSDPNWITPHRVENLSPGEHGIVVSKQGYNEARQSVTVKAGGEIFINATLTPPRGEIDISTRPPAAEVLIDGKSYGPSPVRAEVDAGQHAFLVRQAGREPIEGEFVVQDQAVVQRTIDLPPKPPTPPVMNVAVTTNPPSATVYVDGAPISGKTPISFHLSPGHHILIIFAGGYRPIRREVDVPQDGALTVNETLSGK